MVPAGARFRAECPTTAAATWPLRLVKALASVAGPPENRPLRAVTLLDFFFAMERWYHAVKRPKSHAD